MFLAAGYGIGLGAVAGLTVGPYLFRPLAQPKDFAAVLDQQADSDDQVEAPEPGSTATAEMRALLPFTELWTTQPDYERVSMLNRVLSVLWPTVSQSVVQESIGHIRWALDQQVFSRKQLWFIEDIAVGGVRMRDSATLAAHLQEKHFHIGTVPPRVGGIKTIATSEDELVVEVPLLWGSNCKLDIGVGLRVGPLRLYVPLQLADLQLKAEARITVKPLVTTMPCVGGVAISLLKVPHVDCSLRLLRGVDLMSLPGIKQAVHLGLQWLLGSMLLIPNAISFPIMKNYGVLPPAKGALNINLLRAENLRSDNTFVRLSVREDRPVYSKPVPGTKSPQYLEDFHLLVDDFQAQTLALSVYQDGFGWDDREVGTGELAFGEVVRSAMDPETGQFLDTFALADFIKAPMTTQHVAIKLRLPFKADTALMAGAKGLGRVGSRAATLVTSTSKKPFSALLRRFGRDRHTVSGALHPERSLAKDSDRSSTGSVPEQFNTVGSTGPVKGLSSAGSMQSARHGVDPVDEMLIKDYGTVYLKVTFLPFFQPHYDDELAEQQAKAGKKSLPVQLVLPGTRNVTHKVSNTLKGVLTVQLIRCVDLLGEAPNTYVRMLVASETEDSDQVQKSKVVYNENNPRWGDSYDFVNVPCGSVLHITVYDKASLADSVLSTINVFSNKTSADESKDVVLGRLQIPVKDVARNGSIKDIYTLEDARRGQVELRMIWQTCHIAD